MRTRIYTEKESNIQRKREGKTTQNMCVGVYISSSSSSCRAGSTDIPDPLSPLFPIAHRPRQVFGTTSRILT